MKKRIAIVVPEYRTSVAPGGGVSTVADFVFDAFTLESHWEVEIISPRMWNGASESQRIKSIKSWWRGPQTSLGYVRGVPVSYVGSHFSEIEALRYLPRRILRDKLSTFDAIFVVCGTPAFINSVKGTDKPILAQVATTIQVERARLVNQGSIVRKIVSRINRMITYRLDKSGIRIPDAVLVENPWMMEWGQLHGAQDVEIIIPGIDTNFFSPGGFSGPQNNEPYLVSVGRLSETRKDFGLLVRAYAEAVANHNLKHRLVIAGRGDLPADVYAEIDRLGVRSKIDIRRDLSPEELRDLYRGAELFVMSSSEEGLGLVLIEALACGTPIISTATEGAKSVVKTAGVGTLVEFGEDIDARFAKAMVESVSDRAAINEEARRCREAAIAEFSMEGAGNRFREAVNRVLSH